MKLHEGTTEASLEYVNYDFGLSRRTFVKTTLGAGLMLAISAPMPAQESGQRGRNTFLGSGARNLAARIHLGTDGKITILCGKVEAGQGARAELSQAAAEELRVPVSSIRMLLADTALTPDDGMTAGSGSTPRTVPAVRRGAAAARNLLIHFACAQWKVNCSDVQVRDGKAIHARTHRVLSYADLAGSADAARLFGQAIPSDVALTPANDWKVMGTPVPRPTGHEIVTGAQRYPSDLSRPGMLYGKVLRAPAYHARLLSIDLSPARTMTGVVVVRDGEFVGVAAPSSFQAEQALAAISRTARWQAVPPQPSSEHLFEYLRENAEGGVPQNPFAAELSGAKSLHRTYHVPYIQHAPLEPRAAVAEWQGGRLTVWTGSQNPFGVRDELASAFHIAEDQVRVVIPDFGAAFGGKHTGEYAVEAARIARAAGKPVSLRWTREEEFTWAYFRPAGVIEAEASLDAQGKITTWHFININSGPNAVETPYSVGKSDCRFVPSRPPLRHGSYRALAATANTFAREVFMDELAALAGADPLAFRHAHLDDPRLRAVLDTAAHHFGWRQRTARTNPPTAVGLACGTEKGSYVAACVEIAIDREQSSIHVRRVCQAFECGAIVNPTNLHAQVQGAIIMGIGAALREEMQFDHGRIRNASFSQYLVPRLDDVPEMDIHLVNRPDLPSAGAGETPIIAIAPAIANAVLRATGESVHALPVRSLNRIPFTGKMTRRTISPFAVGNFCRDQLRNAHREEAMHRKLRTAALAVLGTACLVVTSSCAKHSYSDQYYLVATNIKLPYWQTANDGLMKAANQYGVKAEMRGPDNFDPQGEVQEFETVIARKPAGILVSVADPALMQPEIDKAIAANIPVITIDSDSPNSHRLYFIGTNNLQAGRLGGERIVEKLHGKGNVVFFTMPGQPNLDERLKGYKDAFSSSPDIHIVQVVNIKGDSGNAFDNTQAMVAKTGKDKIDAFICLEASAGKDVAEALKRAHATDRELVAMDVDQATLNLVKEGVIDATISQKPFTMAYYGLKQVVEVHENPLKQLDKDYETDPFSPVPAFVDTGTTLVDKNNVDLFLHARQEAAR